MQEYQTVTVCSRNISRYAELLDSLGYVRNDKALLTWDIISSDNVGECVNVEVDDEGYPQMLNNLIDVGMYAASEQ